MRIVMLGTGPFAVPTFQALLASRHVVPALITRPTRQAPGRHRPPPTPMRDVALAHGLPIEAPESINDAAGQAILRRLAADLLMVCDYGQILSAETLALARYGGINLHASLLPKYRGAAPINWALYRGETETGVTVIHMTPGLDAGPALSVRKVPIEPHETAPELEARLAALGAEAVAAAIDRLEAAPAGLPLGTPQDATLATKAPRLKKEDGRIDWTRTADQIRNQVRAFQPWPGSYTALERGGGEPLRLVLLEVRVLTDDDAASKQAALPADREPGRVLWATSKELVVATGRGCLSIARLQPAGKRAMRIDEFLNGCRVQCGDRLS